MQTRVRRIVVLVVVGMMAAIAVALGTGRVAYEVTAGVSMEPTYHAGDLVVIASMSSYRAGDIIAYRRSEDQQMVLHRIVSGDAAGYVLKGDNNQSVDPTHPAADRVIGRVVLHIPKVGAAITSPIGGGLFVGVALTLLGALLMRFYPRRTAGRVSRRVADVAGKVGHALVVVDAVVLVAVIVAFAYPSRPAALSSSPPASQTGAFAYHADVPVSETYPNGELVTGDPVFMNLVNAFAVSFHYDTTATSASVSGAARLDVAVLSASGWHTTLPLVPTSALVAGTWDVTGNVDLQGIRAVADRVAIATGVGSGSTLDVTITASVSVSVDDAKPILFTSQMPFHLTPLALTLSNATSSSSPQGAVVASTIALAAPVRPAVQTAGVTADQIAYGLLAALVLFLGATVVLWPATGGDIVVDALPA